MGVLDGQVALITGAARGQGRSHAVTLAAAGADIIAIDICRQIASVPYAMSNEADLAETVAQVEALGRRVVAVQADVRDAEALVAAADSAVAQLGRLDIVVANAGIATNASAGVSRTVAFRDVIDVNLTGVHLTLEATRRHLIEGGRGGSIVLTSSLAGLRGLGASGGYTESKHALVGLMRAQAIRLAPHRIRVNSVHPTNVATPMILNDYTYKVFRPDLEKPSLEEALESFASLHLLPLPYIESVDVSNAILFLVSDAGRYITGITLPIDLGGAIK